MTTETFKIQSGTNRSVSVSKFTPKLSSNKSIVISSATGVLQGYYSKFAIHFSTIGFTVYTFDYSGIGGSDSNNLKQNTCNLSDWAIDQSEVLAFAKKENPIHKLTLITHSIGGQLIGLNPSISFVDSVIMICSQSGYWKLFRGFDRFRLFMFWYVLIPFLTPVFGYFPAKRFGLFENIPKQVAYQWRKWGIHPNYFLSEFDDGDLHFKDVDCNVFSVSFPRDQFASKASVDWLTDRFSNAIIHRQHIIPKDLNISDVRHFGFFKSSFKQSLWKLTEHWIDKTP
ncbi:MAG: alpha/beta fold hydrolase [Olleya sp.]